MTSYDLNIFAVRVYSGSKENFEMIHYFTFSMARPWHNAGNYTEHPTPRPLPFCPTPHPMTVMTCLAVTVMTCPSVTVMTCPSVTVMTCLTVTVGCDCDDLSGCDCDDLSDCDYDDLSGCDCGCPVRL